MSNQKWDWDEELPTCRYLGDADFSTAFQCTVRLVTPNQLRDGFDVLEAGEIKSREYRLLGWIKHGYVVEAPSIIDVSLEFENPPPSKQRVR